MEKTIRVHRLPTELIDRTECEQRLPPGAGLMIAFGASFVFYVGVIAAIA